MVIFQMSTRTRACLLVAGFVVLTMFFTVPVHAKSIYVNDKTTQGDSWTTNVGSDTNSGLTPDSPVETIDTALTNIVEPGDTIFIDSGTYNENVQVDTSNIILRGLNKRSPVIDPGAGIGVFLNGVRNVTIRDMNIKNSGDNGINMDTAVGALIRNVTVENNGDTVNSSGIVIESAGSKDNQIKNSLVINNDQSGILFQNSSNSNTLTNVSARDNGKHGLNVTTTDSHTIEQSTFINNTQNGVVLDNANDNTLRDNSFDSNPDDGLRLKDNSDRNRIIENKARNNTGDGFDLRQSDNNTVISNFSKNNGQVGFRIDGSNNLQFEQNQSDSNSNFEIRIEGIVNNMTSFTKNNIIPAPGTPNSSLENATGNGFKLPRNWWNSTDTTVINGRISESPGNVQFSPFRLSRVDTAVGSDTIAPASPPDIQADTSVARQVTVNWDPTSNNEETASSLNITGYRIYKSTDPDSTDWTTGRIVEVPFGETDYVDTNVTGGQTYYYRVTALDSHTRSGQSYENESFYSRIFKADVPRFGPGLYVNDTSTVNDKFTQSTGSDTSIGTRKHPFRSIQRALAVSVSGDSIYVDAGTYNETLSVDTSNLNFLGAGDTMTFLDGFDTSGSGFNGNSVSNLNVRFLTIRNYGEHGINLTNVTQSRFRFLRVMNNDSDGIHLDGTSNNYFAQNQIDSNAQYQISVSNSTTGDLLEKNNIFTSPQQPDSGVINPTGSTLDVTRNWWGTPDSGVIQSQVTGDVLYGPFRLGIVDTGVGADTEAPNAPPNITVDTSTVKEITLDWDKPTSDEDGGARSGLTEYRIYRISQQPDTFNWIPNRIETISNVNTTSFTDTTVQKGVGYFYRITAVDNKSPENQSYFSGIVSGTYVNRVPVADTTLVETLVDSPVNVQLSGSDEDGDTLEFSIVDFPDTGTLTDTIPTLVRYDPDTFVGTDTFGYVVHDGIDTSSVAGATIQVFSQVNVFVEQIRSNASDTPLVADGSGTATVEFVFRNTGRSRGRVVRDANDIGLMNALGELKSGFQRSLSGTNTLVPGNDTAVSTWVIQAPGRNQSALQGYFRAFLQTEEVSVLDVIGNETEPLDTADTNNKRVGFNVATLLGQLNAGSIDRIDSDIQNVTFTNDIAGNGEPDGDSLTTGTLNSSSSPGDSVILMVQHGDSGTIDTPLLNPAYNINRKNTFSDTMRHFDRVLEDDNPVGRNTEIVDSGIILLSLWVKEARASQNYAGDSPVLNEPVEVTIKNIPFTRNQNRLHLAKLQPHNQRWTLVEKLDSDDHIVDENNLLDASFTVPADVTENGAGFSIFRLVTTRTDTSGQPSETIVYPNPFVPTDGQVQTGCYNCSRSGIYFGAGPDIGFPVGTKLTIYTITGQKVMSKESTLDEAIMQWDGRTRNGDFAASGVYLYHIKTPDGSNHTGKFAIVR